MAQKKNGSSIRRLHRTRPALALSTSPEARGDSHEAMGIGPQHDGVNLCAAGPLWLGDAVRPAGKIGTSVRIGISRETRRLLRFYERGSPYVAGPRRLRA